MADEADEMLASMKAMAADWHARVKEPDLARQLKAGTVKLAPLVADLLKIFPEEGGDAPAAGTASKPVKGKAGPAEAAKAVLDRAKAGRLSAGQLEAFLAAIDKLSEESMRKVAEALEIDAEEDDLRTAIADRLESAKADDSDGGKQRSNEVDR